MCSCMHAIMLQDLIDSYTIILLFIAIFLTILISVESSSYYLLFISVPSLSSPSCSSLPSLPSFYSFFSSHFSSLLQSSFQHSTL